MPWKLFALGFALFLSGCSSRKAAPAGPPPSVPVSVAIAARESMPIVIRAIGSVEPFESSADQIADCGRTDERALQRRREVKKGDLLFEIDPRPYREALAASRSQSCPRPRRNCGKRRPIWARTSRNRNTPKPTPRAMRNWPKRASSHAASRSRRRPIPMHWANRCAPIGPRSIALARRLRRTGRLSDRAKLDLTYCEIRSPISGRAGNLLLHVGNYVKSNGDTTLVVINRMRPVFVTFGVPEERLAAIRGAASARKLPVDVTPQDAPASSCAAN